MITDRDRLRCPQDGGVLRWPEARCRNCDRQYRLGSLPSLKNPVGDDGFDLYDFRPLTPEIKADQEDLDAHRKIVEGLLWFEDRKLRELGFAQLEHGLRHWPRRGSRALAYGLYLERTLRNAMELVWHVVSGKPTKMLPGETSIRGSFAGYSRTHEMFSDFARPNWLGWCDGRLTRAPALLHHYRNMLVLRERLARWGCREVLEFGCGTGLNLLLLKVVCPNGTELSVSGFDYAISRVLAARATVELFGLEYRNLFLADGLTLPLANASFDVVFSHYVVEQMAGYEEAALDSMLRVARVGVVLFETAVHRPTLNQRIYMTHSGYSRRLPEVVRARSDVLIEELRNVREDRFFGAPNVLFVLKKKLAAS